MGHNAPNPLFDRLAQALKAAIPAPVRPFGSASLAPPDCRPDDVSVRDWVLRHHGQYGLDPVWILTGQGQPPGTAPRTAVPVTPVFAMPPIDPRTGHWQPLPVGSINLPPSVLTPSRFVVRMDNRAMEPRIRPGAYLVVETAAVEIPGTPTRADGEARLFAVDVPGEGLLVRMVHDDVGLGRLVLTSLDRNYPPLFLPRIADNPPVIGRVVWVAQAL
jgi:hypothetical protein